MNDTGADRALPDEAGLRHYLDSVAGHAPLTKQEEGLLVRRSRAGDRAAFDRLIDANLQYVVRFARRFRNRGLSDLDLIAEGTIGLILAIRHDPRSLQSRIIAVAAWTIHHALRTAAAGPDPVAVIMLPPGEGAGAAVDCRPDVPAPAFSDPRR